MIEIKGELMDRWTKGEGEIIKFYKWITVNPDDPDTTIYNMVVEVLFGSDQFNESNTLILRESMHFNIYGEPIHINVKPREDSQHLVRLKYTKEYKSFIEDINLMIETVKLVKAIDNEKNLRL